MAVNPFKEVPLYGNRYVEAYMKRSNDSPHVYAIADTAIREMIRGGIMVHCLLVVECFKHCNSHTIFMFSNTDEVNQSIIIRLVK